MSNDQQNYQQNQDGAGYDQTNQDQQQYDQNYDYNNQNYDQYNNQGYEGYDQNQNQNQQYDQNYDQGYADESLDAKQAYLNTNIVEPGYDAARFAEFLDQKKPGMAVDVNLYTMTELYEYVTEFQNMIYDEAQAYPQQPAADAGAAQAQPAAVVEESKVEVPEAVVAVQPPPSSGGTSVKKANPFASSGGAPADTPRARMLKAASDQTPIVYNMLNSQRQTMFSGKNIAAHVSNPQMVEEKGFLSSTQYLHFDVAISGDVQSAVNRRDQDFSDLCQYLTFKYPNALVPQLQKPQVMKKFSTVYMEARTVQLTRFMDYCAKSETIRQDAMFQQFLDQSNYDEFKKSLKNVLGNLQEIKHFDMLTPLASDKESSVTSPDTKRVDAAVRNQKILRNQMRIYGSANERLHSNFKRLHSDLNQVGNTIRNIRECFKTLETMEERLADQFKMRTNQYITLFEKMHNMFGLWEANVAKHADGVNSLSHILEHKALESQQINAKLEYILESQAAAKKKEDKLCSKRGKLLNEDSFKKWENDKLLKEFGEEEIKKLLIQDPQQCLPFILPTDQQKINDSRLMSAYLTESLITEIDRSKVDLGFKDLVQEFKTFVVSLKGNLQESQQICDQMDQKLK